MSFGIAADGLPAVDFGMTTLGTITVPAHTFRVTYFNIPSGATTLDWIFVPKPLAAPYVQVIVPTVYFSIVAGQYKVTVSTSSTAVTVVLLVR